MADRFPAQIWIGGQLSRTERLYPFTDDDTTILQGLIGALADDGASHEYGDRVIRDNCTEAGLGEYLTEDGKLLNLKCDQAVNGEFEATEQFCIEHDIPFDRWSDHYCEYDGENTYWRPGMDSVVIRYEDSRGNEIVCGDTVRKAMECFDVAQKNFAKRDISFTQKFGEGLKFLHDACPELPPDLEVFNLFT